VLYSERSNLHTSKKLRALDGLNSPLPRSSSPLPNPLIDPSMLESETDRSFSQSALQQSAQKRLHHENDTEILHREKAIEDIAQGIIELSNIFQELQTMVIDQGSMLDRIDFNVESMATDVKEAAKELTVATNYQRRSLKRKIMLLLLLIIAGMFILLGLKLSSKGSSKSSLPPVNVDPAPNVPASLKVRRLDFSYSHRGIESKTPLYRRDWRRRRRRSPTEPALIFIR